MIELTLTDQAMQLMIMMEVPNIDPLLEEESDLVEIELINNHYSN
jgi:hypothetical protein